MKRMKSLLTKALILAMVICLLIPMPVAAKSKAKDGKLLKSVTYYDYNDSRKGFDKNQKTEYTYDKKNNPSEIKTTNFTTRWGIPWSASFTIDKPKYKYKGSTAKTMKLKNSVGRVVDSRKYSKGKLKSSSWTNNYKKANGGYYNSNGKESMTYNKKGFATKRVYSYNYSEKTVYTNSSGAVTSTYSDNSSGTRITTYTITQKKKIPSFILASQMSSSKWSDSDGDSGSYSSSEPDLYYTKFNKRGFVTESGYISVNSVTKAQTYHPEYKVKYKTKKGVIVKATVYSLTTNESGTITKSVPESMYKFKYIKTKINPQRYYNMLNSIIGVHNAVFSWY